MQISEPFFHIRPVHYSEKTQCIKLVRDNWGDDAAERCFDQFVECFKGGKYAPVFLAATNGNDKMLGFAAYHRTMQCTWNIIWLVVDDAHKGDGMGRALIRDCLGRIEDSDGMLVEVVTQVPGFYQRVGFAPGQSLGNGWYLQLKGIGEFGL